MTRGSLWVIALLICLVCALPAESKGKGVDEETMKLINLLVERPELMNVQFLSQYVGMPENWSTQNALSSKNYYWYKEPTRFLQYHLAQTGPQPGMVTQSEFSIGLPKSQLTHKEMEKIFGEPDKRVFNQQSVPVDIYDVGPNTHLAFTQPYDMFRVTSITVRYDGPPLAPLTANDFAIANQFKQAQAQEAMKKGEWHKAIRWLESEVRARPNDPVARLQLAQGYRKQLMLNNAITQYRAALALAGGDQDIVKSCHSALVDMKVLPKGHDSKSYLVESATRTGL